MCIVVLCNDTAATEIYTLSLHDALPIWPGTGPGRAVPGRACTPRPGCTASRGRGIPTTSRWRSTAPGSPGARTAGRAPRSEEHTSELQSRQYLVCRLLLEKKKIVPTIFT